MLARRPSPTLFPYTTLFRSLHLGRREFYLHPYTSFAPWNESPLRKFHVPQHYPYRQFPFQSLVQVCPLRSEEHTSELQSRGQLVCRLLLVNKKNNPDKRKED